MWEDPIVAEVRKHRQKRAAKFEYDIRAMRWPAVIGGFYLDATGHPRDARWWRNRWRLLIPIRGHRLFACVIAVGIVFSILNILRQLCGVEYPPGWFD